HLVGEQFAKTGTGQSHQHQFAALLLGGAHGNDEPDPTPQFAFAKNGHGMADRRDLEGKSKDWRIQIAEQAVRNGGFLFEQLLKFPHIELSSGDHFEQPNIVQAAGRNFAADDEFGTTEEVSLEIDESHVAGLLKLVGRFQFFREHFALRGGKPAHHANSFLRAGCTDIDFDDVGKFAKRKARIVGREVIERNEIASRFQPLAGGDDAVFGLNRLQDLGHDLGGGQQREQIFEEDLTGAIHEGEAVSTKGVDTEEQGAIERGAGGKIRIGVEVVLDAVSKKNLVSEHVLGTVKNWLAGNEALPRQRKRGRGRGFLFHRDFGRDRFHICYIGATTAELHANLRREGRIYKPAEAPSQGRVGGPLW